MLESSLQSIQSSWKIQTIPVYKRAVGKPCITLSIPWAVSKKKRDTKKDKGESMTRALYTLQYAKCMPKGTSLDETTSNSEKIKPIALAVIELHLPEGIRQASGRQAGGRAGGRAGRQGRAGQAGR